VLELQEFSGLAESASASVRAFVY